MPDKTLLEMLDEVRGTTLQILSTADERTAHWAPPGLQNTILWHAGHAYVIVERLTMESLGRKPEVPEGWLELFDSGSRPASVSKERWPALEAINSHLQEQHVRLRRLFSELTESELSAPSSIHPQMPVRRMILHGLQDEASHKGEMWLLRKMQARR